MKKENKRGFTLVELLAVIVVLAVIAIITTPMIIGVIDKAKKGALENSIYGYIDTVEKYMIVGDLTSGIYFVEDGALQTLKYNGIGPTKGYVEITENGVESAVLCLNDSVIEYKNSKAKHTTRDCDELNQKTTEGNYREVLLNGMDPIISDSMIPIIMESDGTVKKADIQKEWYRYYDKQWANAIILKNKDDNYQVGEMIPEEAIESYFVWIPKYRYQIWDLGLYNRASMIQNSNQVPKQAQEIQIIFGDYNTQDRAENECTTPMESGQSGVCQVGDYMTHPAFLSFNSKGFWVGKYMTGYRDAMTSDESKVDHNDASKVIIKPNVFIWRENTLKNIFEIGYHYQRQLDSHMMKNTEWGAVAYLSHSQYGINKEVNINNNTLFKTGYSALLSTDQTKYPGEYGAGEQYNQAYNTKIGTLASTTGNITGIYDMSGGLLEIVAGYIDGNVGNSGLDTSQYDSKYFDRYHVESTIDHYQYRILGDATGEMGPFTNAPNEDTHNGWYGDHSYFIGPKYPWFNRGSYYQVGILASQFSFLRSNGSKHSLIGFRIVLTP